MVRTSQRLSSSGTKHKRVGSTNESTISKRFKTTEDELQDEDNLSHTSGDDEQSDFDQDSSVLEEDEDESEDDYDSSDNEPKARKKSTVRQKKPPAKSTSRSEVWRDGVSAGLGPGKQVIIKKPKARSAGKIPYEDHTLHPNTFLFLAELKQNNERQWLKMHDPDFRQSERDWYSFLEKLTERIVEIDETVPELPVKDVIYRIYRDVRFSPDPTPYKSFFSVAFSRTGRKGPYAKYYVQISGTSGGSFVGGLWHPEAAPLAAMRENIDRNPRGLKDILLASDMRREFLQDAPKNDNKVVAAFVDANSENALKTRPKGYNADHADIDLLRLRNYVVLRKLDQEELIGDGGLERVARLFACMQPFITYLNSIVMPDEDQQDDVESQSPSAEEEAEEEEDDDDDEEEED